MMCRSVRTMGQPGTPLRSVSQATWPCWAIRPTARRYMCASSPMAVASEVRRPWRYPVYVTDQVPHAPEGLLVQRNVPRAARPPVPDETTLADKLPVAPQSLTITWGEILGAGEYRLYRRAQGSGSSQRIYSGPSRTHVDRPTDVQGIQEFYVTAINGNGESAPSIICDTDPKRLGELGSQARRRFPPRHRKR